MSEEDLKESFRLIDECMTDLFLSELNSKQKELVKLASYEIAKIYCAVCLNNRL